MTNESKSTGRKRLDLLLAGRKYHVIRYVPLFAQICRSVPAGLMLSQMYYFTDIQANADGWFEKIDTDWQKALGMTRDVFETARRKLLDLQLIEAQKDAIRLRWCYRLVEANIRNRIDAHFQSDSDEDFQDSD